MEGNRSISNDVISRLHGIMRPFILRRMKKEVAKQLPPKYEHVVMCKLSRRQAFLYEEFMARSSTKALMSGGNYMGMMNILMQLRKVYYILYCVIHITLSCVEICIICTWFKGVDVVYTVCICTNCAESIFLLVNYLIFDRCVITRTCLSRDLLSHPSEAMRLSTMSVC